MRRPCLSGVKSLSKTKQKQINGGRNKCNQGFCSSQNDLA